MVEHHHVDSNGLRMHVAEAGLADGPAVVLCHGFPECWYSWRHQLQALGDAGYHVLAPDQRGYGTTDRPLAVDEYTQLHLVGDIVGVLDAFGIDTAVVVGHDWGGPVAWHCALLRPDRFPAVAALSVHFGGVGSVPTPRVLPTDAMRAALGDSFLYVLHFQEPGVAEAELDADLRRTLGAVLYGLSGDLPRDQYRFFEPTATSLFDLVPDLPAGKHIEQPALFIGAEHDSVLGQTPDAVLATRAVVPALRDPVWVSGSGHWIQQERPHEVNAALLAFLRSLPGWEGAAG